MGYWGWGSSAAQFVKAADAVFTKSLTHDQPDQAFGSIPQDPDRSFFSSLQVRIRIHPFLPQDLAIIRRNGRCAGS